MFFETEVCPHIDPDRTCLETFKFRFHSLQTNLLWNHYSTIIIEMFDHNFAVFEFFITDRGTNGGG